MFQFFPFFYFTLLLIINKKEKPMQELKTIFDGNINYKQIKKVALKFHIEYIKFHMILTHPKKENRCFNKEA